MFTCRVDKGSVLHAAAPLRHNTLGGAHTMHPADTTHTSAHTTCGQNNVQLPRTMRSPAKDVPPIRMNSCIISGVSQAMPPNKAITSWRNQVIACMRWQLPGFGRLLVMPPATNCRCKVCIPNRHQKPTASGLCDMALLPSLSSCCGALQHMHACQPGLCIIPLAGVHVGSPRAAVPPDAASRHSV